MLFKNVKKFRNVKISWFGLVCNTLIYKSLLVKLDCKRGKAKRNKIQLKVNGKLSFR